MEFAKYKKLYKFILFDSFLTPPLLLTSFV
nr:MAG TPA: hypothetical protein [Caudoviricetes sp.]